MIEIAQMMDDIWTSETAHASSEKEPAMKFPFYIIRLMLLTMYTSQCFPN